MAMHIFEGKLNTQSVKKYIFSIKLNLDGIATILLITNFLILPFSLPFTMAKISTSEDRNELEWLDSNTAIGFLVSALLISLVIDFLSYLLIKSVNY